MKTIVIAEQTTDMWEGDLPRLCECTQLKMPQPVKVFRVVIDLTGPVPVQRVYAR